MEGIQYCGGISSVLWGDNSSTCGGYLQYCGGCSVQWGIASVLWRVFSTLGDYISTCRGITSVQWGDNICTVEGIQYSGGRILISAWLVINNDERISTFFVLRYEIFIQADFMHVESWTDVLQVQPCFEIIYNFIFGVLYLSFKFNCLCNCTRYL